MAQLSPALSLPRRQREQRVALAWEGVPGASEEGDFGGGCAGGRAEVAFLAEAWG